jgi:serpin B
MGEKSSKQQQNDNKPIQKGSGMEKILPHQERFSNVQMINIITQQKVNMNEKNCFFSTYGLFCLLDVLKNGSNGKVHDALSKLISSENVHSLAEPDDVFKNTSLIFFAAYLELNDTFMKYLRGNNILYDSIEMKDLSKRIEKINILLEDMTNNKIKKPLNVNDFDQDFVMLLINVLYFCADWDKKFEIDETKNILFKNGKSENIPMMNMYRKNYNYYESKTCQYISLSYRNYSYKMLIALPKENENENENGNQNPENMIIEDVLQRMEMHTITTLTLPKFRIEQEEDLREECIRIGLNKIFIPNCDFDVMFENSFGGIGGSKYIGKIKQKTFINLDENGTEASAVTHAIMRNKTRTIQQKFKEVEFIADHPFSFYILGLNNIILFAGRFFNY